jgi:cytochrome c oxidase subunit 2
MPEQNGAALAGLARRVLGLPPDWSSNGAEIDRLLLLVHLLMAALAVGWFVYFLVVLWRFRASRSQVEAVAAPRGRLALGLAFAVFLVELGLMVFVEIPVWARRTAPSPEGAFTVRVVAEQFAWNFHYPGEDGEFGATDPALLDSFNPIGLDLDDAAAADDLFTINELHVPDDRPIRLLLTSKDVIHGFYLPYFRVRQDILPGQQIEVTFTPTRSGRSEIGCAQLCGLGHYRMKGFLTVEASEEFAAWYEDERSYM